jgi:hypothetical protein
MLWQLAGRVFCWIETNPSSFQVAYSITMEAI